MAQQRMQQLDQKFKVSLIQGQTVVEAPLPETFGMTVGSEFSTPFDMGGIGGLLSKFLALGGISQKFGVSMKNMFTNPEPTEISFDLEFDAYYSALEEVLAPVIALAKMSLGDKIDSTDAARKKVEDIANDLGITDALQTFGLIDPDGGGGSSFIPEGNEPAEAAASKAIDILGFVSGPEPCIIRFGNIYTLSRVYVTSVGFRFSNVVDTNGFPMSATASVTVIPEMFPTASQLEKYFKHELIQG